MNPNTLKAALAAAALSTLGPVAALASTVVYQNSFENAGGIDAVAPGTYNAPASLGTWSLSSGTAIVSADAGPDGSNQIVTLSAGAQLDRNFGGPIQAQLGSIVFVEGWARTAGSSLLLQNAVYPAGENASAIVHFSANGGVQLLDGDKVGGAGNVVSTAFPLGVANQNTWHRITVKLDFTAKEYDAYIRRLGDASYQTYSALGFRDNVSALNGFRNMAESAFDFDAFRLVKPLDGDANGDSVIDASDVVRVAEYQRNGASDPILAYNADVVRDGLVDGADLTAIVNTITTTP